tara:strand:+ start:22 stop:1521 length:1500 start_codon:yes stop_codon:yes gene_type:complete
MKKKLNYREKLIELADIYDVKEIKEYVKRRKNLTSGQLELILRKNKIIIPKDFKTSFFKENFSKPLGKFSKQIDNIKDDSFKSTSKLFRRINYLKEDSRRNLNSLLFGIWKKAGVVGIEFLNIIPKLGKTYYNFFSNFFTELFNGIYSQNFNKNKAGKAIIVFFITIGIGTVIFSSIDTLDKIKTSTGNNLVKNEKSIKKPEIKKNEDVQKKEFKVKKEIKKQEPKVQKQKQKVAEIILPDLNLKTETVLNLFKDVDYNLNKVRYEKVVKPIYFTQFPKDLDEIQSVKLKKETFIKIVLPLIVAENEKILDDKYKLKKIISKRNTTDDEKQWLRQKFLEYKVKGGDVEELNIRIDIIPVSIALAQAAKESGWGTSRFALEGNAIFGQWTWNGKGIEPLLKDKSKSHKILKFPILRASVKAYQNNLNTHKSYVKFREKRKNLRDKNKKINGLELSKTLSNYAQTGSEYIKILAKIIIQNRLMDFEPVRLANSVKRKELNL